MKKIWGRLVPYFLLTIIVVPPFWQTILNISSSLVDWRDHAFIVWVMSQNIKHLSSLDFVNFFNTNAYYPHTGTLFLSDLLLPQSIIMMPLFYVSKNLITSYNILLILTVLFNAFAAYLFWNRVFRKKTLAFAGSLLTTFSPFFHYNISHFQMINYWPFFLSLYFLFGDDKKKNNFLFAGALLAIQFLASAYLGVFLLSVIVLYFATQSYRFKKVTSLKNLSIVLLTFIAIDGFFLIGYLNARNNLGVVTNYHEYVGYSAHLGDYLFSSGINSVIHNLGIVEYWNSFSKHSAANPGIFVSLLALLALIKIRKNGNTFIGISFSGADIFFLLLIVIGFIFSLGPRLQFNGTYDVIPLPYHFVVKYIPFINSIRAPARWTFIIYIGLIYFALKFIGKIKNKALLTIIFLLIFLEYYPIGIPSTRDSYLRPKDSVLASHCEDEPKVVLEIPVTHFDAGQAGIAEGLTYITKTELESTYHKCVLVNGYSGFDLPYLQDIKNNIYSSLLEDNSVLFYDTVKNSKAELLVVNKEYMLKELKEKIDPMLEKLISQKKLTPDKEGVYIIN